ncbi:MAG TPA: DUF6311 domain-containing protein [Dyella sp.]|uniref:DUF6311 domain-containing protein n=1 Tax=Dyella sp. TaxID=1869338 RepID=UPI002C7511FC|nr:DUF6311 domain-containing protein [Dyella sp.]HTV85628.1 DUF6311 domain-containing protein [Dyella sp.]
MRGTRALFGKYGAWLVPVAIGAVACLLVTGGVMLWPGHVAWLVRGDLAQSYLGWAFYRNAAWTWPPGADPLYGVGLHASVYYTDSIPVLALLFKLLASWLPTPFQYFGLWVAACFVLQALFAWRLLGLATSSNVVRSLGLVFFVLAPPMLLRLGGHMALVGHWIVLASIYLYLRPDKQRHVACWSLLLAVAFMVHAYLFAIAASIWIADMVQRYGRARDAAVTSSAVRRRRCLFECATVGSVCAFAAWLAGFFMISSHGLQAQGFGYYKMNVLAPVNGAGWSWFGFNFPLAPGEDEGFNYLGLGGMLLVVSAIVLRLMRRDRPAQTRMTWPLVAAVVILALAAVTPNVGVGAMQWHMPLPEKVWAKLSSIPLQSSGRLFWAAYYLVLLAAIFVVLRALSWRGQVLLLSGAVLLQCLDLHASFFSMRAMLVDRTAQSLPGLHGAFWDAAGARYRTLRRVPFGYSDGYALAPLAFYANSHHMGTDVVQLGRMDYGRLLSLSGQVQSALLADQLDPATLYILDDRELSVARAATDAHRSALFQLDGWNVLAPGWTGPLPSGAVDLRRGDAVPTPFARPFQSGFAAHSTGRLLLGDGWNALDAARDATTLSDTASLFVPAGSGGALQVVLSLHRNSNSRSAARQVDLWAGGRRIASCHTDNDSCRRWVFTIPATAQVSGFRKLQLRASEPSSVLHITLDAVSVQ